MTCKNCGTELPESSKFCTKCGTPTSAEEMNISSAGVERAVPKGFSAKKNIIIIIIAAILLIGGGITAIAVVNSHSASSGVVDKLQLAERYLNEQNYEQAIIEYQKVLEIEPMNVDAYLGLADAYLGTGDTDKALEWLNKGLEQTGDARIQAKIDKLFKPAEPGISAPGASEPTAHSPLTANELSWLVEPTYEFEHIRPIPRKIFYANDEYASGQNALSDKLGCYEAGFPSYASTDEYYEVKQGGAYTLFCQSDRTLYTYSSESMLCDWTNGEIVFKIADFDPIKDREQVDTYSSEMVIPHEFAYGFPGYRTGYWDCKLLWDTYTKKAYLDFEDDLMSAYQTRGVKPISPNLLNKNYPIQKYDLSRLGNVPQTEICWTIWADGTGDWQEMDKYNEVVAAPVDERYALWSPEDKLLTDFIYDDMCNSSYGLTAASRGGKWGYLDENGNEITEFIYDAPWLIKEDTYAAYPCTSDTMVVSLNGKIGVLYRNGKTLIEFGEFDDLAPAWNDQLWAKQGGKWGLIDLKAAKKSFGIDVPENPTALDNAARGLVTILGEEYDVATTIHLDLSGCDITDEQLKEIAPEIARLTNLTTLNLRNNQISDITPLSRLTDLTELDLYENQISNVSPLANLTNLEKLWLGANRISDVSPLASLTNLTLLHLSVNIIDDIMPLAALSNLTELYLYNNRISYDDVDQLREHIPNCYIST